MALVLLRIDFPDGRGRRHYAAHSFRPVDHRMEAGHRHCAAAVGRRLDCGIREIPADPRIPHRSFRDELGRVQKHLLLGILTSAAGSPDWRGVCRPVHLVFGAAASAAPPRAAARRHPAPRVSAGRARLVHGRERPCRPGRGQPIPPRRPPRSRPCDLCRNSLDGPRHHPQFSVSGCERRLARGCRRRPRAGRGDDPCRRVCGRNPRGTDRTTPFR